MKKIVLTGGPGAGKSTIISYLKKNLEKEGYKVITVSETASDLFNYSIPFEPGITNVLDFQNLILNLQYAKENSINNYIENAGYDKPVIVLYDRGIFDNRAYLDSDQAFKRLLKLNKLSYINLLDEYDLVIDMVSASILDKDIYENNDLRKETKQEAKDLDTKTTEAWLLHHNLNMVMPTENVEDKNKQVLDIIWDFLSCNKKIDYTYVKNDEIDIDNFKGEKYKKIDEFDMYLKLGNHSEPKGILSGAPVSSDFIVTERKLYNESSYLCKIIVHKNQGSYLIKSEKIPQDMYEWLISSYDVIKSVSNNYIKYIDNYSIKEIKTNRHGTFEKVLKKK